ncbi:3-deoxy-7-phosphoheptulonate synthase [Deinococcus radiopugnans]|uniref:Phospho-2-dehydro-3-deoxyheptonate aldolase n=1 Tax=Deinococcus radiopugnans ATCC 19172 TaxID=585398 RepID=A0A5C4Y2N6_9DEIO|nr:3-deoxy-7-phosphoheptulonate synthase [Deinococcus radiopugnans]MBB6017507.1 3-deoxy-7-phosphoheptulonate synthase [Deinococcus radiopugnans ATCC 19172]TNM69767.1 3-deoxy-7-phosphoheptulonate synthase [Deinococcus radiopugnans ATCC 19172]
MTPLSEVDAPSAAAGPQPHTPTRSRTENLNVSSFTPLPTPRELKTALPLTPGAERTVLAGRQAAQAILRGEDPRLLVVVGPCSVHDSGAALEYARRLAALRERVAGTLELQMRVYVDKPRTTVGWRGFLMDPDMTGENDVGRGLALTRRLMLEVGELGLPVATELLDPFAPQYLFDAVAWACLGARTTESQTHRVMASAVSAPMGFKNGTGGGLKLAVDAMVAAAHPHVFFTVDDDGRACIVQTQGNPGGHLILRGGRNGPNYAPQFVQEGVDLMTAAGLAPAVMVDCSHANSGSDFRRQGLIWRDVVQQRLSGQSAIRGLMLESNLEAGKQGVPADPNDLKYGVSVTDACVGWAETEALVLEADAALRS